MAWLTTMAWLNPMADRGLGRIALALGAWLALVPLPTKGEPPIPVNPPKVESPSTLDASRLDRLVAELSSPVFLVREKATAQIDLLGDEHLPSLAQALETTTDLEVKTRLHGIVAKKKNVQRQQQLRTFLLEADPTKTLGFHGWVSFQRACGVSDRRAKFTFVEMLEEYPELVYTEIPSKEEAFQNAKRIERRISEILTMPNRGNLAEADAIALIYVAVLSDDLIDKGIEGLANQVFSRHPFTSIATAKRTRTSPMFFVEDTSKSKHYARMSSTINGLFSKWVARSQNDLVNLTLCFNMQNDAAATIARRVLSTPQPQKDMSVFELSMQAIARFGTKQDLPLIESFLNDKTIVMRYQRFTIPDGTNQNLTNFQVQARDLALATSSILNGEYPFDLFEGFRAHSLRGYVTETLGSPEKDGDKFREERIKRFQDRIKNGFPSLRLPENEQGIR
jgi:hypothetical protein